MRISDWSSDVCSSDRQLVEGVQRVIALGADGADQVLELLLRQQAAAGRHGGRRGGSRRSEVHSAISMPSQATSQPAASTAPRSAQSASRMGLVLLMWISTLRATG